MSMWIIINQSIVVGVDLNYIIENKKNKCLQVASANFVYENCSMMTYTDGIRSTSTSMLTSQIESKRMFCLIILVLHIYCRLIS